jgi:hypothetical protein
MDGLSQLGIQKSNLGRSEKVRSRERLFINSPVRVQFVIWLASPPRNDLPFVVNRRWSRSKDCSCLKNLHFRACEADRTLNVGPITKATVPPSIIHNPIGDIFRHARQLCQQFVIGTVQIEQAMFWGSVQESGKPRVFRGFWTFVKLAHPSSSRCGNVETRVLCGFPSSGAPGMNLSAEYHQSAPGASFPQRGPSFSRNWRLLTFPGHLRPRCAPLRKPRNMHVFTDSRSEPVLAALISSSIN